MQNFCSEPRSGPASTLLEMPSWSLHPPGADSTCLRALCVSEGSTASTAHPSVMSIRSSNSCQTLQRLQLTGPRAAPCHPFLSSTTTRAEVGHRSPAGSHCSTEHTHRACEHPSVQLSAGELEFSACSRQPVLLLSQRQALLGGSR